MLKLLHNPDVTVRRRGVMEKCTYCVQRIEQAKIDAKVDAGAARDPRRRGPDRLPAGLPEPRRSSSATSTTPTGRSRSWKAEPLNYGLLDELNTRPRTTYLAQAQQPATRSSRLRPLRPTRPKDRAWPRTEDGAGLCPAMPYEPPVVAPGHTPGTVTDKISSIVLHAARRKWWFVGFGLSFALLMVLPDRR